MLLRWPTLVVASVRAFRTADVLGYLEADGEDLSDTLLLKENASINKDCFTERFWPPALQAIYKDGKMVGSGATACVAIAKYKGVKVAVKVGKRGSNLEGWRAECDDMKQIRLTSCRQGVLKDHEQYVPTCIDVGHVKYKGEMINYYTMHAAGTQGISQLSKQKSLNLKQQKNVGAQVVASIHAMHKAGFAHNDLHGNNIVLDPATLDLQLIDLGDAANYPGWIRDYKRDSNAVWRWLGEIAQCPDDAKWYSHLKGRTLLKEQAERFKQCMKDKWSTDDEFNSAIDVMLKGCVINSRQHNVERVYKSNFIQSNLPKRKRLFPADDVTKGCESWSEETWQTKELEQEFSNHFKCDQIPTYESAGRKGKKSVQCARGRPKKSGGDGHCFTARKGVNWGCGGATDWDGFKGPNKPCKEMGMPGGGLYEGGCLTPDHPGYRVTKNWR